MTSGDRILLLYLQKREWVCDSFPPSSNQVRHKARSVVNGGLDEHGSVVQRINGGIKITMNDCSGGKVHGTGEKKRRRRRKKRRRKSGRREEKRAASFQVQARSAGVYEVYTNRRLSNHTNRTRLKTTPLPPQAYVNQYWAASLAAEWDIGGSACRC
ncbi:hypothetical protein K440DRAFT_628685 [Wilcoxina mikolae CBS 423.85]|nr:hypothetical protein K440DRAFT_628685 [Wilcoxina mikolae CBS 423.85]